jgi:hypothetical protein
VGSGLVQDGLAAPTISFLHTPAFGVVVEGSNPNGYFLYRVTGGVETLIATLTAANRQVARYEGTTGPLAALVGNYWLVAVAREYGATYWARPRTSANAPGAAASAPITDYLGLMHTQDGNPDALILSRGGDWLHEHLTQGPAGERNARPQEDWTQITWTPVKIAVPDTVTLGATGERPPGVTGQEVVIITRTPVKVGLLDGLTIGAIGEANRATMGSTGRYGV